MSKFELDAYCVCDEEYQDQCHGECHDDARSMIEDAIDEWVERNDVGAILIQGANMGWQRLSGWLAVEPDGAEVVGTLNEAGQCRLVFTIDENDELSVVRYSHDEPTGASFTLAQANRCDSCHAIPCECEICTTCGESKDGDNPLCDCE